MPTVRRPAIPIATPAMGAAIFLLLGSVPELPMIIYRMLPGADVRGWMRAACASADVTNVSGYRLGAI